MYEYYKIARNKSWEVLIECRITTLPLDLNLIAEHYHIEILKYSSCGFIKMFDPKVLSDDGFITTLNNRKVIFLNDKIKTRARRRFTVGHELGHGILEHPLIKIVTMNEEIDSLTEPLEMQANVFSRDILAPACVLNSLGVSTVNEIMNICDISEISAQIRLKRLQLLRERGAFFTSKLEKQVYEQFKPFIDNFKK